MSFIRYEVEGAVATIMIDRHEKRNAMTFDMLREFLDAIDKAGKDPAVAAIIITGVPGSFCAGTDLSAVSNTLEGVHSGGAHDKPADSNKLARWAITQSPKPTIGAIDGAAVGMGAEFATQCDIRIATPRARFAWNFASRGLVPDSGAGSWLLPRQIGLQAALKLVYSGEFLSGEEAFKIGFVSELVEPDALLDRARALAKTMTTGSPLAIRMVKDLVYQGLGRSLDDHLVENEKAGDICFHSLDHKEGVAAFVEKREPRFVGR